MVFDQTGTAASSGSFLQNSVLFGLYSISPSTNQRSWDMESETNMQDPINSDRAAGNIALQSLVFVLIKIVANGFPNPQKVRETMRSMAEELADTSTVPDVPSEMKAQDRVVREQAKMLIGLLTSGGVRPLRN